MSAYFYAGSPAAGSLIDHLRLPDRLARHVAVLDRRGVILDVNDEWRRFGRENGLRLEEHGIGVDYCALVAKALGPQHRLTLDLQALLAGRSALLTWTYPCHAPDRKRWFNLIGAPLAGAGTAKAVLYHLDITPLVQVSDDPDGPPPDTSRAALAPDALGTRAVTSAAEAIRSLSDRRREVLALIGQGLDNDEIARTLSIAPNTVRVHVAAILKRLGLRSRSQAALLATEALRPRLRRD